MWATKKIQESLILRSALLARHRRKNHGSHGRKRNPIVNGAEKVADQVGDHRKGSGPWPCLQPYLAQQRPEEVQQQGRQQEGHPSHHHQTLVQMGAFFQRSFGSLVHWEQCRPWSLFETKRVLDFERSQLLL